MVPKLSERHGRLTVVRHAGAGLAPRLYLWRCDCGTEKVASLTDVRRGMVTSCGCAKRENAAAMRARRGAMINDLTGQRFGKLQVTDRASNNKHGCAVWRCICDCGTEKLVSGNHLVTGNTASCGCAYRDGLTVRTADARARSNAYVQARYRSDQKFALNRRAQQLVHASLRARGSSKSGRWEKLVGYTLAALEQRLRETMPAGYTWDDFLSGLLHIDHITPLAAFNFTCETDLDFRRAWALSNLQLLPGPDNIAKADKLAGQFQPSLGF